MKLAELGEGGGGGFLARAELEGELFRLFCCSL